MIKMGILMASIVSNGSLTVIVGIACAVVFGFIGIVIGKKVKVMRSCAACTKNE